MVSTEDFGIAHQEAFSKQGFVRLGKLLSKKDLAALQGRIDAIMLGEIPYEQMQFQLDAKVADYGSMEPNTVGHKGASLAYRRITGLEQDPAFLAYMQHPVFRAITAHYIGDHVSVFRAMFMNKPANQGTVLPWHQDVGEGWGLDQNPVITVWTALDDAVPENGCMQVVPGSNNLGILNPGHYVSEADQQKYASVDKIVDLKVEAGESILLHNWLMHRSGVNKTDTPRRAFSVAYMDAATLHRGTGQGFPVVFGPEAP
ncbi:MAG: phytanoyl-CoA dioxygenase family protein [bacterium]|nr:phytanoyl-CoA dioxygenase family protein [bacterium]